jgi:thiol-disulfide isomerase/thioredoxin
MMSELPELEEPPRSLTPWIGGGVVLVAAGVLAFVVYAYRGSWSEAIQLPRGDEHAAVGQQLQTLSLQPLTGSASEGSESVLSEADLAAHVTLINFWGTWCPPCLDELPHIKELEQHFRSHPDFRFVSVSCSNDPADDAYLAEETAEFMRRTRTEFPTYQDENADTRRAIYRLANEFAYPTTLIIGRDGLIKAMWVGFAPGIEKQMREILERELAAVPADQMPADEMPAS